jgi:hypothetical protein
MNQPKDDVQLDDYPNVAVVHHGTLHEVRAGTAGVAADFRKDGRANVIRYGVALVANGGHAIGGANSVTLVHGGGRASSGDGGVSVVKNAGDAECGIHGVAYSSSPRKSCGRVRGAVGATLVCVWVDSESGFSASVRVGDCVDGLTIESGVWYTVDTDTKTWKRAFAQS